MKFDAYTLGFSNRNWEQTLVILKAFEIQRVVDIRMLPGSRRTPQYNLDALERVLPEVGIDYVHLKNLGGLRKPSKNSMLNAAWQNDGFRGYADYMQTPAFETALGQLTAMLREKVTVFCCTEAVFWRCHRQLVADALVVRGYRIGHIFHASKAEEHHLTNFAWVEGTLLTYPALI